MAFGDTIVRLADLAEAEGRLAWDAIFRLTLAVLILIVVASVILAGFAMLAGALYLVLRRVLPIDGALAIVGACLILLAVMGGGWAFALSGKFGNSS